jgi:predicted 3-demethylubiquinone-9 3-methyltransferase (glyoxalase superfamily)
MQKINPFLWFNENAEEAVNFYLSVFPDASVLHVARTGGSGPEDPGSVMVIKFSLFGQEFVALNGGPQFQFTEAVSFVVNCETQEEVDHYWSRLTEGGKEMDCGWLKDRFGLVWQIVPTALPGLLMNKDPQKAQRVMQAMRQMKKIDIHKLEAAQGSDL